MLRMICLLGLVINLFACTNNSTNITGTVSEAINFEDVEVFYNNSPDCEFEVVAHIKIPGEYFSRSSLIDGFRQRAAAVGAPMVQITFLQRTGTSEFFGSARALRCE